MSKLPEQSELGDMQGHIQMPTTPSPMPTQPTWPYPIDRGDVESLIRDHLRDGPAIPP